jgi:hypothetical protein
MKKSNPDQHSEAFIQAEIVKNFTNDFCLAFMKPRYYIFHVPNENQQNHTNIGVKKGVADLVVLTPIGETIFFEVKNETGKQSTAQSKFQLYCLAYAYEYYIVRSYADFLSCMQLVKQC